MKPKFSLSPFMITPLPSLLLIIIFIISSSIVVADVVKETCKICEKNDANINYNYCVSSFRAQQGSTDSAADLRKLGAISLSLIQNNVSKSVEHVEKLLQKKELDSYRKARLKDCLELYSDALVSVEEGKKAYKAKRYDDANIKVSSVMDAARVCEDGFSEKEGVSSPMKKWNKDTFQLTAIALSIINMHP